MEGTGGLQGDSVFYNDRQDKLSLFDCSHTGDFQGKESSHCFFTLAPGCSISLWLHSRCIGTWGNGLRFPLTIFIYSKYTSPFGQQLLNNHFQAIACGHMEGSERKTALNVSCDACLYEKVAFWVICMVERKKGLENLYNNTSIFTFSKRISEELKIQLFFHTGPNSSVDIIVQIFYTSNNLSDKTQGARERTQVLVCFPEGSLPLAFCISIWSLYHTVNQYEINMTGVTIIHIHNLKHCYYWRHEMKFYWI